MGVQALCLHLVANRVWGPSGPQHPPQGLFASKNFQVAIMNVPHHRVILTIAASMQRVTAITQWVLLLPALVLVTNLHLLVTTSTSQNPSVCAVVARSTSSKENNLYEQRCPIHTARAHQTGYSTASFSSRLRTVAPGRGQQAVVLKTREATVRIAQGQFLAAFHLTRFLTARLDQAPVMSAARPTR